MSAVFTRLPFPPSLWKAYYRRGKFQTKSTEYCDFIRLCNVELHKANYTINKSQRYDIHLVLCSPTWLTKEGSVRKKDLDNYIKCLLDTVTDYLVSKNKEFDDSMIFSIYAEKRITDEEFSLFSISPRQE